MAEIRSVKPIERSIFSQQNAGAPAPSGLQRRVFSRNYPLANFPERITLRIDADVEVINGIYGDKPSKAQIHAQSDVLVRKWGMRDGGLLAPDYDRRLESRYASFHTPAFSARDDRGRPCAAILPVQMASLPNGSLELADEKMWDLDSPEGKKLVVRKLVSEQKGLAKKLLGAYLAYAKVLFDAGLIDQVVAFTRPSNLLAWRGKHPQFGSVPNPVLMKTYLATGEDKNIMLHIDSGALVRKVYLSGCPADGLAQGIMIMMDYTHQMMNLKV
ncbi:MAG: hypothetical protein WC717_03885 [Candidatus Micrarchaeia archaeon]|jgi:hypothetical protein